MKNLLVTSALPYANGRVHLGHLAGAYLPADIYVRWQRLKGVNVRFVCGSDEHGVPITLSALKRGITPQQVVDENHEANGAAFAAADVKFDIWSRTSSPEHHALTKQFFTRLFDKGYIEKRLSQQLYSEKLKMFLPDRYVEGTCPFCKNPNARGDECEVCGNSYEVTELINPRVAIEGDGSKPVLKDTYHWYLRLDAFEERLKKWVDTHDDDGPAPWRANAQRESRAMLKRGLRPRAITRDTSWGVEIPLSDPDTQGKRFYVWFDAPIGYVTFTQQLFAREGKPGGWKDFWQNPDCPIVNFIGKDNIQFHTLIWPAMLIGVNDAIPPGEKPYQLVTQVVANEFLKFGDDKFSKSRGTAIEIGEFAAKYGSEALRFYLTANAPESSDSAFTWDDFAQRYNGELADVLGNFVHRVVTFSVNKLGAVVPEVPVGRASEPVPAQPTQPIPLHAAFAAETQTSLSNTAALLDGFQFRNAINGVIACARSGNVYFDSNAPWKSVKTDLPECHRVIRNCLDRVAALGLMLRPFLPKSAAAILANFSRDDFFAANTASLRPTDVVRTGAPIAKPEVLFKKLEATDLPPLATENK
ncbi:MAG TPA: methionine--tRNA ligase [Planctomycetota bacterium]|nr:methionine--tRNA ligase [Planctomycetota bacterium]